jgi:PAS domain S-box-containing protein
MSDTGTGMDAATLQKIFVPFFMIKDLGKGAGMTGGAANERAHSTELQVEQLRLLYGSMLLSLLANLVLAALLVGVQWPVVSHVLARGWLILLGLVQVLRGASYWRFRCRNGARELQARNWLNCFRIGVMATGLLWGVAGVVLYPAAEFAYQAFLAFVLAGVAAGAISSLAADRVATLGFILPALLPLLVNFAFGNSAMHWVVGLMGLLFMIFMVINAERLRHNIHTNVRLRVDARVMERRLSDVITGTNIGTWEWNVRTGEAVFNERWAQIVGYTLAELEPGNIQTWMRLVHPDDLKLSNAMLERCIAGEVDYYNIQCRMCHKDGHWVWVHNRGRVVSRTSEGKPLLMSGSQSDISERRHAELALREAHDKAQQYLDTASVMMLSLDTQGCVRMINNKGCEITGYSGVELLACNWFDTCVPLSDRGEFSSYYHEVMAGRDELLGYLQMKLVTRNKGVRTLYLYSSMLRGADGGITGALFSGEDITDSQRIVQERRQLQMQLNQAQKMDAIGQLTGGIAHDFNTMLAGILGFAELAQEQANTLGDQTLVGYLEQVIKAGERARDLVIKMLAFSRHRNVSAPEPVLLSAVIPEMLKLLRPLLPASIKIHTELEAAPPVFVDTVELQQLMMNLCINARDAMRQAGTLNIVVRKVARQHVICDSCHASFSGNYTELCVGDTGTGIDPATLQKIFDPFFTTKEVGKGTGMGLAMLHGIMHGRNGHIEVESKSGVGSQFRLMFPASVQDEAGSSRAMAKLEGDPGFAS